MHFMTCSYYGIGQSKREGTKGHMPPPRQIGDDFDDSKKNIKLALGAYAPTPTRQ